MKLARKIDESASDVVGYDMVTDVLNTVGVEDGDFYSPERLVCS